MPFKSRAQMRKFGALMKQGKISKKTFDEFAHSTPNIKNLPMHVKKTKSQPAKKGFKVQVGKKMVYPKKK